MIAFDRLPPDYPDRAPEATNAFMHACRRRGVHLTYGYGGYNVRIIPPLVLSKQQVDFAVNVMEEALHEVLRSPGEWKNAAPKNPYTSRAYGQNPWKQLLSRCWQTSPEKWVEKKAAAAEPAFEVGLMDFRTQGRSVLLVSPKVPPYGGIAIQAGHMERLMNAEGIRAGFLASNIPFPPALAWMEKVRGLRPFFRSALMCTHLWRMAPEYDVVHVMACSWLYFFVVVIPALLISRWRSDHVVLNYRGGEADKFFARTAWLLKPFFERLTS